MPIPKPTPAERQADFITRCIPVLVEQDNLPRDKAAAVCYSTWNNK